MSKYNTELSSWAKGVASSPVTYVLYVRVNFYTGVTNIKDKQEAGRTDG